MKKKIIDDFFFNPKIITFFLNVGIALCYIVLGKLGLSFASVNPSTTAIWAPTGIALATILIFGYRVIPAIFFGAFFVNSTTAGTIPTSLGIATGNTLEAIIGSYLVNNFAGGIHAFDSISNIVKFTFFAAILSTIVSANIGVTTLILGKLARWNDFWSIWTTWWLGDMGGDIIFAPLLLLWKANTQIHITYRKTIEFAITLLILSIVTSVVFSGAIPYAYLCIPIAVWIAFVFGQKGGAVATVIVTLIAVYYTLHGQGPFTQEPDVNQSLILLQTFLDIFSLTALIFAATILEIKKGEKNLASHEERFRALIENSFDAVVLVDAFSNILYASPSVKRILGYGPEEMQGKTGFDLIAPYDRPMTTRELSKLVLTPNGVRTVEYRTIRKDNKTIWVEATGTNLLLEPSVQAVVINFRDITERKILHEKMLKEKMEDEAMLTSIGDSIIATDNRGKITMVNHACCQTIGWSEKELKGKFMVDIISMEDEEGKLIAIADRPLTKVLSLGKKVVTSKIHYYIKKDKTKLPVRYTITPIILNRKLIGTIEVFHDITQEKEIDQAKDEFITLASHELRTPITAVNGLLSMILHGDYGPINEGLKKPLENIHISAQRQIHLINDLLDVSRLQTGKITVTLTNFGLKELLTDVAKSLMPLAQQKNISFIIQTDQDITVQADSDWTKQIVNNLIGNALKFTDTGSISVIYHNDQEYVLIEITDTGVGIDPADQHKLFGKFQQLGENKANKSAGSGLGLYLSRELAHKMGGDIILKKTRVGKGSTFTFSLPIAETKAAQQAKKGIVANTQIAFSQETR